MTKMEGSEDRHRLRDPSAKEILRLKSLKPPVGVEIRRISQDKSPPKKEE